MWPHVAGDFAIDCAGQRPAWWFIESPVFAAGRCGTADTFGALRPLLDSPDGDVRLAAESALTSLTFVGEDGSPELPSPTTPAGWDAWYREHRGESRAEWAARRLGDTASYPLQLEAAEYLSQLKDRRWLPALRAAAAAHPSAWVRLGAARGVAEFEPAEAIAFLARELNHRDLWICVRALEALNTLTGQSLAFDFRVPSERARAVDAFAVTR
jgi:HEAT repeat protein